MHAGICPKCGIAYGKYRVASPSNSGIEEVSEATDSQEIASVGKRLLDTFTYIPERVDPSLLYGRVVLYVVFVVWGARFIFSGIDWEMIGSSFMHSVNLPFHEFGHVLFGFLGQFMGILGGSLFQVLFPLIFVFVFSIQMQDNFAASICLWWCGQNFVDVSPYIADAPYRNLPLILGMSEDYHDWGNLLVMTNSLDKAQELANTSFLLGSLLLVLSFVWGGWLLWRQYEQRPR